MSRWGSLLTFNKTLTGLKQSRQGPEVVPKIVKVWCSICVERGAGLWSGFHGKLLYQHSLRKQKIPMHKALQIPANDPSYQCVFLSLFEAVHQFLPICLRGTWKKRRNHRTTGWFILGISYPRTSNSGWWYVNACLKHNDRFVHKLLLDIFWFFLPPALAK